MLNPFSYIIMRFIADNPGIWIMHCHNDYHLNIGMAIIIVAAPDEVRNYYLTQQSMFPPIPTSCTEN
jgi:iron transport multicopper oxidase